MCSGDIPGVLETNSPFISSAPFTDMVDVDEFDFSGRLLRSRVNKSSLLPYLVFANKGARPWSENRFSYFCTFVYSI